VTPYPIQAAWDVIWRRFMHAQAEPWRGSPSPWRFDTRGVQSTQESLLSLVFTVRRES